MDNLNKCKYCKIEFILEEGIYFCSGCGLVSEPQLVYSISDTMIMKKPNEPYKRQSYYKEKLKMLARIKTPYTKEYRELIIELVDYEIETIIDLKKVLKQLKQGKYYKYIYYIFYELTGKKLIKLNYDDITKLNCDFLKIEDKFRKMSPDTKNFPSYNVIIRHILKKNGYKCYKHIIKPFNYKEVSKRIKPLLK